MLKGHKTLPGHSVSLGDGGCSGVQNVHGPNVQEMTEAGEVKHYRFGTEVMADINSYLEGEWLISDSR